MSPLGGFPHGIERPAFLTFDTSDALPVYNEPDRERPKVGGFIMLLCRPNKISSTRVTIQHCASNERIVNLKRTTLMCVEPPTLTARTHCLWNAAVIGILFRFTQ